MYMCDPSKAKHCGLRDDTAGPPQCCAKGGACQWTMNRQHARRTKILHRPIKATDRDPEEVLLERIGYGIAAGSVIVYIYALIMKLLR